MNNDSIKKTLIVTLSLCIICSILVSGSAVLLKDKQNENKRLDKRKNILMTAGLIDNDANAQTINATYDSKIKESLFDFDSVQLLDSDGTYDQRKAAKDPSLNIKIEQDYAGIKNRAKKGLVYFVLNDSKEAAQIILPVHGKGLWSTLYGFISFGQDLNTVTGLSFYEHAETPGLGGEVDNPKWKSKWNGKIAYGDDGLVKLEVIKGSVIANSPNSKYQVDGLSGATITSRGVSNMMKYWLSKQAYGKLIQTLNLSQMQLKSLSLLDQNQK